MTDNAALADFLANCLGRRCDVVEIQRLEGGWSRQLHKVGLGDGTALALRGEIPVSVLHTDLKREHEILTAIAATSVPLPQLVGFEQTGQVLGHRFLAMEWVWGTCINPWRDSISTAVGPPKSRSELARSWITDIAALHHVDVELLRAVGIDSAATSETYVDSEVASWASVLRNAQNHPGPLVEEACAWLEKNRPPGCDPPAVVHGDLRLGNMMVRDGHVAAFLDWEMAGIGDWRADIGYCLMPYNAGKLLAPIPSSSNQLMGPREFLDAYLETSGQEISDGELRFFMVLACTKMIAILCTGIDAYRSGLTRDPRLAWTSIAIPGLVEDICSLLDQGLSW